MWIVEVFSLIVNIFSLLYPRSGANWFGSWQSKFYANPRPSNQSPITCMNWIACKGDLRDRTSIFESATSQQHRPPVYIGSPRPWRQTPPPRPDLVARLDDLVRSAMQSRSQGSLAIRRKESMTRLIQFSNWIFRSNPLQIRPGFEIKSVFNIFSMRLLM